MSNCLGPWIPAPIGSPHHEDYRHRLIPLISERLKLGPKPATRYARGTGAFGGRISMAELAIHAEVGEVEYAGIISGGHLAILFAARLPN
ncbi:MAG: hypothetical protein ACOH1E_01350 [Brevundimonas sp.]